MTGHSILVEMSSKVKREQLSVVMRRLGTWNGYYLVPVVAITEY